VIRRFHSAGERQNNKDDYKTRYSGLKEAQFQTERTGRKRRAREKKTEDNIDYGSLCFCFFVVEK
jgi:hypothetical protein